MPCRVYVIGGVLTVADDLLKNDGKRFLDMMEQLAERRIKKEEEASIDQSNDYDDEEDEYDETDEEEVFWHTQGTRHLVAYL